MAQIIVELSKIDSYRVTENFDARPTLLKEI
jgi:hypothetical protein